MFNAAAGQSDPLERNAFEGGASPGSAGDTGSFGTVWEKNVGERGRRAVRVAGRQRVPTSAFWFMTFAPQLPAVGDA